MCNLCLGISSDNATFHAMIFNFTLFAYVWPLYKYNTLTVYLKPIMKSLINKRTLKTLNIERTHCAYYKM